MPNENLCHAALTKPAGKFFRPVWRDLVNCHWFCSVSRTHFGPNSTIHINMKISSTLHLDFELSEI